MKRLRVAVAAIVVLAVIGGCQQWLHRVHARYSGTLELTEHGVGARVPGRITTLMVEEGHAVTKGQLLATLDRLEQAQRDHARIQALFEQGGATQQAVEQAALTLDDQRVVSPVEGVVLLNVHEAGEVVSAGSPIVVIGDTSQWWVKIFVPEGAINRVQVDQRARVHFDGIARTFQGHVSSIAPRAEFTPRNVQTPEERVTQTFAVKVALDERDAFIRPGVAADVELELAQR